jgi:DNA polymerase-1
VALAKQRGYAETIIGRRRYLPALKSSNFNLRSFGERVAMNMPVQGTAADIIKLAMIRVARRLRAETPEARLLLQVHDELIAECPEEQGELVASILTQEMEGAVRLPVPLTAEAHRGYSWYDAK